MIMFPSVITINLFGYNNRSTPIYTTEMQPSVEYVYNEIKIFYS